VIPLIHERMRGGYDDALYISTFTLLLVCCETYCQMQRLGESIKEV